MRVWPLMVMQPERAGKKMTCLPVDHPRRFIRGSSEVEVAKKESPVAKQSSGDFGVRVCRV